MLQQPPSGPWPPHCREFTITLRHTTVGRTALDEWSAWRSYLYLTTHNNQNRHVSMPPVGFELAIPATLRRQTSVPPGSAGLVLVSQTKGQSLFLPTVNWEGGANQTRQRMTVHGIHTTKQEWTVARERNIRLNHNTCKGNGKWAQNHSGKYWRRSLGRCRLREKDDIEINLKGRTWKCEELNEFGQKWVDWRTIQTRHWDVDKKPTRCHLCVIFYFSFTSCSTCFGQPCARLQELTTA